MLLISSVSSFEQSYDVSQDADHEFKKFRIAVNLGHVYIPAASFGIEGDFVAIPVWGLDFQYWFNPKWGLALKNNIDITKYTINNSDDHSDGIERINPVIISVPILFSPWDNGLMFLLGPGIELEGH